MTAYVQAPTMQSSAYISRTPFVVPASHMDGNANSSGTIGDYVCTSCCLTSLNCLVNVYTLGLCNYVTSGHMCWGGVRLTDNGGYILHAPCVDCMDPYNKYSH